MQCRGMDAYAAEAIRFKARQLVGKAGFTKSDREDLEQELALDFLRRSRNFNPDRSKRSTFTTCVVDHHVATILEGRRAPTRDVRREGPSLDAMIADNEGNQVERITTIDARANRSGRSPDELHPLKLDVQAVIETLLPRLRELAEGLKTHSVTEIAQRQGMSRRHTHRLVERIRRHFDEAGLRGYLR